MKIDYPSGATPLDPGEIQGLIPSILTQQELNQYEKANIGMALAWTRRSRKIKKELLSLSGLRSLHKEMFHRVWRWAGDFRSSEKNIGVAPHNIQTDLHNLCEDVKTWIQYSTYNWDEIGVRFHHRLVFIHAFANGNGRHARISADLLLQFNKQKVFTWGSRELIEESEVREMYISALKMADKGDYGELLAFARR